MDGKRYRQEAPAYAGPGSREWALFMWRINTDGTPDEEWLPLAPPVVTEEERQRAEAFDAVEDGLQAASGERHPVHSEEL